MSKKKRHKNSKQDLTKIIMHKEYNHNIYVFQNRKRYIKEDVKKFKNKRNRRREKQKLKKEYI